MKKGISLIVLVITIIVMIIIAGAIILSLNSSNVTSKATYATVSSDRANYQAEVAVAYADYMSNNYETDADGSEFTHDLGDADFTVIGTDVYYIGASLEGAPTTDAPAWYSPRS